MGTLWRHVRFALRSSATLTALCLPLPVTARAQAPTDPAPTRAILELIVNEVSKGEAIVLLRANDVLIAADKLTEVGLRGLTGRRETIESRSFVSLASLAPAVLFVIDQRSLTVRLTARPELLGATVVAVQSDRPPDLVYRQDTSAFLNYAATARGLGLVDLFTETGVSIKGVLFQNSVSRIAGSAPVRGLTSLTVDDRRRLSRWVVGDTFANGGLLGGALLIGGIGVSREYGIDPYFNRYPTVNLSGSVTTPSVVEVYVNDKLLRREQLAPGQFELTALSVPNGRGDTRLVIRDVFGREQIVESPYYLSTSVLAKGLQEYSYVVGFDRVNDGTTSWAYRSPVAIARHRVGLTNSVTAGFRFEAIRSIASGGPLLNVRLPRGDVEIIGAASKDGERVGGAVSAGYAYLGRPVSFGAAIRSLSPIYRNVSLRGGDERSQSEATGFASFQVGSRGSVTLQHRRATSRGPAGDRTAILGSARISVRTDLFVNASRNVEAGRRTDELFVGINVFFGHRTSGGISQQRRGSTPSTVAEIQQSLPAGTGFGYRARLESGATDLSTGSLQYQGPFGRYEARREGVDGQQATTLNIAGGIVSLGRGVFFSRPVEESFALVQVPGVKGVRAFASNQEIGRTDRHGNLLVPNLISYYGNRLAIADQDVPLDHTVAANQATIAPPFRGGALVKFPVQRMQGVSGTIVVLEGVSAVTPAYGELIVSVGGAERRSPLGTGGEFYLDDVPAGKHRARVEYQGGSCEFLLDMPDSSLPIVALGRLPCLLGASEHP